MSTTEVISRAKAIVLFSGGLDSTACVHLLTMKGFRVTGLFVDYGQLAVGPEKRAVSALQEKLGIEVQSIRVAGFCDLRDGELIGRNLFLFSTALFYAKGSQCVIGTGIHAGTGYYDCSPEFLASVDALAAAQSDGQASILAPFSTWSKRDVYDYALAEHLPISETYSCERGSLPPCGTCASCRDRKELRC